MIIRFFNPSGLSGGKNQGFMIMLLEGRACMVAPGGHAQLPPGGMCGKGVACMAKGGHAW